MYAVALASARELSGTSPVSRHLKVSDETVSTVMGLGPLLTARIFQGIIFDFGDPLLRAWPPKQGPYIDITRFIYFASPRQEESTPLFRFAWPRGFKIDGWTTVWLEKNTVSTGIHSLVVHGGRNPILSEAVSLSKDRARKLGSK